MCGRYSITTPVEALSRLFRFAGPLPNLRPRYNVSPTQQVPIVRPPPGNGQRELAHIRIAIKERRQAFSFVTPQFP